VGFASKQQEIGDKAMSNNSKLKTLPTQKQLLSGRDKAKSNPLMELFADVTWEDWDDDHTECKEMLALNAATYKPQVLFDIPASGHSSRDFLVSPEGTFAYRNDIIPKGTPLRHFLKAGFTIWNGDTVLPKLIDMKRHCQNGKSFPQKTSDYRRSVYGAIWMSITPGEMITQRSGVQKANSKVLVGGLGLGWFLRKVCQKPSVDEVVVVEKSQELLDWYGYDLCRKHPKVKEVICDDVYAVTDRFPDHQLLLDIWPVFHGRGSSATDPRLSELRAVAGDRVWAWGMD
jgi:hypothetical protein